MAFNSKHCKLALFDEEDNSGRGCGPLENAAAKKLVNGVETAFKRSVKNETNVVVVALLSDEVFVSETHCKQIYEVIQNNNGVIISGFGQVTTIKTEDNKTISLIFSGGSNPIAASVHHYPVSRVESMDVPVKKAAPVRKVAVKVEPAPPVKKAAPVKKVVVKVEPGTVSAASSRRTRASTKKTDTVAVPKVAGNPPPKAKKQVIVIDRLQSHCTDKQQPKDTRPIPRAAITVDDSDSGSDSSGSYKDFTGLGFTQEGTIGKKTAAAVTLEREVVSLLIEEDEEDDENENAVDRSTNYAWLDSSDSD